MGEYAASRAVGKYAIHGSPPLIDVSDPDSDERGEVEEVIGEELAATEKIRGAGETADV